MPLIAIDQRRSPLRHSRRLWWARCRATTQALQPASTMRLRVWRACWRLRSSASCSCGRTRRRYRRGSMNWTFPGTHTGPGSCWSRAREPGRQQATPICRLTHLWRRRKPKLSPTRCAPLRWCPRCARSPERASRWRPSNPAGDMRRVAGRVRCLSAPSPQLAEVGQLRSYPQSCEPPFEWPPDFDTGHRALQLK